MSRASKLTLGATSLFAVTTIVFVHFQQKAEQTAMHQGVVRDMEQQRIKRERQLDFDMQKALEEEYKREQSVRSSTDPPEKVRLYTIAPSFLPPMPSSGKRHGYGRFKALRISV